MPRRLPPLNALRAFEAAARHNSFTGAASELHVSHAAISRHVRGLEARLGVTLFRKASRGVALTEGGARYLEVVRRAFDEIAAATEALARSPHRQISVSAEPAFAAKWLVHRLGGFRERHPEIDVFLEPSPLLVDLEKGEADLAIRYGAGDWPGVRRDLLVHSRCYPVANPSLFRRLGRPKGPADLLRWTLLHEDGGERWHRWFAAAGLPAADARRGPRLLDTGLAIDAAIAGQGVALADDFLVEDELRAGDLVKLSDRAIGGAAYYLLSLERAARRKPIAAFRDWLLTETRAAREDPPAG
jgi:LysR family glycine cleavage system transcriptional activator